MSRSILKLALAFALAVPCAASASYISNYARWKEVNKVEQAAYLAGVMDHWTRTSSPGEPPWMQPQRTGVNKCMREQDISAYMLVDLVDAHYKAHTADWRVPPASVVTHAIMGLCLADVNSEREKAGYEPWERKPTQISKDN
ncbi:hypothetical protein JQ506_22005 [Shinella sp. PSBB067]|uniref:hypothetical protein n=1 Tax=Shinella sp. PSBB067 TaxID=2715959 RepID=UPI00193AF08A|nr:hypothetical protein [Shinella sp. PSBB067]QRI63449.1 hypothetical protein JQ506_22005 [Shinella sp. PSBB067]